MYTQTKTDANKQQGFSIIELITVITVIAILLALGVMSLTSSQNRAKKEQAIAVADKVKIALNTYYSEKDRYPHNIGAVTSFISPKDATTATAFGDTTKFGYAATTATGAACNETGAVKCEKYTITVKKAGWGGGASDSDEVITP